MSVNGLIMPDSCIPVFKKEKKRKKEKKTLSKKIVAIICNVDSVKNEENYTSSSFYSFLVFI